MYIIKINSFGENVYKIGVSNNVKTRIQGITSDLRKVGHDLECSLVYEKQFNSYKTYCLEYELHKKYKNLKHESPFSFAGQTELFTLNNKDIKELILYLEAENQEIK